MNEMQFNEKSEEDLDFRRLGTPINNGDQGMRLDRFLTERYPFRSRTQWTFAIKDHQVLINGKAVRPSHTLQFGDQISQYFPPKIEPPVNTDIKVLWQRAGIMAVYKPAPLPMHEGGKYRFNTFCHLLNGLVGGEWSAVHRLDRETSGIVLCANDFELRSYLAKCFESKKIRKEYLAIVHGVPDNRAWITNQPIGDLKDSVIRIKRWVAIDGQPAETEFELLDQKTDISLIKAIPKTGRTNQIRIHLAYCGHVIVGDKLYHRDENLFLQYFEYGNTEDVQRRAGFKRLCLHAHAIEFFHPVEQEYVRIECSLPDDLLNFWQSKI